MVGVPLSTVRTVTLTYDGPGYKTLLGEISGRAKGKSKQLLFVIETKGCASFQLIYKYESLFFWRPMSFYSQNGKAQMWRLPVCAEPRTTTSMCSTGSPLALGTGQVPTRTARRGAGAPSPSTRHHCLYPFPSHIPAHKSDIVLWRARPGARTTLTCTSARTSTTAEEVSARFVDTCQRCRASNYIIHSFPPAVSIRV